MNILFDGNYLFHKTFSVFSTYYKGQDMSDVLSDPDKRQVLLRKCIIDMCHTVNRFKDITRVAFVIDSSSWRYNFYADYKYSLTKVKDAFYAQFLSCLNEFENLLRKRGIIVSRVQGAEGDDLMYIWSLYFGYCLDEEMVIITGDSDIRQIITKNVSLLNNNSKSLKFYCLPEREVYWNEYLDADIEVIPTKPFEILLYKVVMGDTSDNIPKLKKGFGKAAFQKFLNWLEPYDVPEVTDVVSLGQWISGRFCEFTYTPDEEQVLGVVLFNLKMTWLNLSVYNEMNFLNEDGRSLLEHMLEDVQKNKNSYNYNKRYTLEEFYGMAIK